MKAQPPSIESRPFATDGHGFCTDEAEPLQEKPERQVKRRPSTLLLAKPKFVPSKPKEAFEHPGAEGADLEPKEILEEAFGFAQGVELEKEARPETAEAAKAAEGEGSEGFRFEGEETELPPDEQQEEWWWWQQQHSFAEAVAPVPEREMEGAAEETDEPTETEEPKNTDQDQEMAFEETEPESEISESLDALEAQISAEEGRVQELERQLLAESDSDTEPETDTEAAEVERPLKRKLSLPKQDPKLRKDIRQLIQRYGNSQHLLTSPSTPPLEETTELGAPRTPPLHESPEPESVAHLAPLLASLLSKASPLEVEVPSPDPGEPDPRTVCGAAVSRADPRVAQGLSPHESSSGPHEWTAAAKSSRHASTLEELLGH